jgi:sugar phosphate isomerase/epimerase
LKLACSTWMMPGDTFTEKIKNAALFGFEGVEIRLFDTEATQEKIKEILKALDGNGLKPSSLLMPGETFRRPLCNKEAKLLKIEHAKKTLDAAAQLGCPTLICPEYGPQIPLPLFDHPKRITQEEHGLLMEYLTFVGDYASEIKAKALIEPINRYETHFFYSLEDGIKCINEVGKDSLFLLADFFHMNLEEVNISDAILSAGKYIGHVHLGDSNRMLPGQGHTDFRSGFSALKSIAYTGFMALECSIAGDLQKEFPRCIQFLKDMME